MEIEAVIEKLKEKFLNFEMRPGQLGMLQEVFSAYVEEKTLLVEAGTGIGKSLSYLIPAMLWASEHNETTVISTHTIALQEQLIQKDIPALLEILGLDLKVVIAKGMHNYVCLRRLHESQKEVPESLFEWSRKTKEGTKSDLPILPSYDLWDQIKAESESCTHVRCPFYKECFFFKARKEAEKAHLIIANHHLLFADLSLREMAGSEGILPSYNRLILDEAHHIEDVATEYFAKRISRKTLLHNLGRLTSDRHSGKLATLRKKILEKIERENASTELSQFLDAIEWKWIYDKKELADLCERIFDLFQKELPNEVRILNSHLKTSFWKDILAPLVEEFLQKGNHFIKSIELEIEKFSKIKDAALLSKCEGPLADSRGSLLRIQLCFEILKDFVFTEIEKTHVRFIENGELVSAELEVAPRLSESLFKKVPTIVLCSATLSTNKDFTFVKTRLGIEKAEEKIFESPFNYETQSLFSIPSDLPDPSHQAFTQEASEHIWKCVEISQGSAFVLFTSYAMLQECEKILSTRFREKKYTLFCQGEQNRSALLNKFRVSKKAILFGTDSFWEGVDVVGDALRLVIIVKLPFKVPTDPLFQARAELIAEKGDSPFFHYFLPSAIVKFKQGFGRLIRNKEDKGCVVCLDGRLFQKNYGKQFLKSLPPCPKHFEISALLEERMKNFYSYLNK